MVKNSFTDLTRSRKIFSFQKWEIGLFIFFISFVPNAYGQVTQDILAGGKDSVAAALNRLPDYNTTYPVLYGEQPKDTRVEAIGYLKGEQLKSTPSAFINNGFAGRIAGLYARQISGEPGNDGEDLSLRGLTPLVLVDGIPRSLYSIDPEEIESVTVLKDALSTAMLGLRSMNGAVLITTRKGQNSPGFHLELTAQTGVSSPIKLLQPLNAFEYATLYNEALANDGLSPVYSQADLNDYKNGNDPYGHPNINWRENTMKDRTPLSRYTLSAGGTGKTMRYFLSLDYLGQQGALKQSPENTYSTNSDYKRYIFRSNVEVNLTKRLSLAVNLFGRIQAQNSPGGGMDKLLTAINNTPNNAYPVFNPDSSLGGNVNFNNNLYAQSVLSGYQKTNFADTYSDFALKRNMDDILKGWWVKGVLSYNLSMAQQIDRSKTFETFQMIINSSTNDTTYNRYGTKSDQKNNSSVTELNRHFYAEASTGYTKNWVKSEVDILLLYNSDSYTNQSDLVEKYETLSGKFEYNIQDKYIIQGVVSYSGNNRYAPGKRFGVFPSAGVAWNIDKEELFTKGGLVNTLKLRASYGLNGNAVAGYYDYIDRYSGATGYYFGTSVSSQGGRAYKQPRDVNTWEKAMKLNIGLEVEFSKERGRLAIDYYHNKLKDLVQTRQQGSALLGWGQDIVQNMGQNLYSGLEMTAGWADKVRNVNYYISGNLSVSDSKVLFNNEPNYPFYWMQRTGQRVGQIFGYVADGFVSQPGEGPVVEGYIAIPGDIKYKDMNKDGVINQFDLQPVGTKKPLVFYGLDFGFTWKNFSLTFLIQGVSNRNLLLTGANQWEFQNEGIGQAYAHQLNHWTPANGSAATYPRLSVGKNVNNQIVSDFWVRKGDFVRLKNAELAYSFNKVNMGIVNINQLRIFINGLNLLNVSDFKQTDPETLAGTYPIQRIINGGMSIKF